MPVGTYGTVKGVTPEELVACGAEIILANTFHLMLRPGHRGRARARRPARHDALAAPDPDRLRRLPGVQPRSDAQADGGGRPLPLAGRRRGSLPRPRARDAGAARARLGHRDGVRRVHAVPRDGAARRGSPWSFRCAGRSAAAQAFDAEPGPGVLFGIIQGGMYAPLRLASLAGLEDIGFAGLAIGGLSVGEPAAERERVLGELLPAMPAGKPRYLMGVGRPGGPGRGRCRGRRSLRLRDADAPCAERPPVRALGRHEHPQCPLRRRHRADRPGLRLLHLPELLARLPPAPRPLRRNARAAPRDAAQPASLPGADGAHAGGDRGRPVRAVPGSFHARCGTVNPARRGAGP